MNNTLPKILLLLTPLLCGAQYAVLKRYGEPYPALILPAFPHGTESYRTAEVQLKANGTLLRSVTIDELLEPVQRSVRHSLDWKKCGPSRPCPPEVRAWLIRLGQRIEPATDEVTIRWTLHEQGESKWLGEFPSS